MKAINKQCSKLMRRSGELWRERDPDSRRDAKLMEQAVDTIIYLKNKNNIKQHAYNQNKAETFEENFYRSVAWYNGYEEEFDKLLYYLKNQQNNTNNDTYSIRRPDFITTENEIMELYWMQLVQTFGDYGTSPRSGWIYRDKLDDCINHITEVINKTYGEGQ